MDLFVGVDGAPPPPPGPAEAEAAALFLAAEVVAAPPPPPLLRADDTNEPENDRILLSDGIWAHRPPAVIRSIVERQTNVQAFLLMPGGRRGHLGYVPLLDAVAARSPPEVIDVLLMMCPQSLEVRTIHGESALHLAFREVDVAAPPPPRPDVIRSLFETDPELLYKRNLSNWLPVHLAANLAYSYGCAPFVIEILRIILEPWPHAVLETIEDGKTALHHLLRCPAPAAPEDADPVTLEAVQLLVEAAPEVLEVRDDDGILAVHDAAEKPTVPLEVLQYLVAQSPQSLEARAAGGNLPLHFAAQTPSVDKIDFLVRERPESIAEANANGCTPLHAGAAGADTPVEAIRALLRLGGQASAMRRNHNGRIPLHLAAEGTNPDNVRCLVEAWYDGIRQQGNRGNTPLHAALSRSAHYPIVQYLVEQNPDALHVRNDAGMLPVQLALGRRNMAAARLLLRHRPESVEETDENGRNLFHFLLDVPRDNAAEAPSSLLEYVTLLFEHGPEAAHAPDAQGLLPLQLPTASDAPLDVVYFLLRHQPNLVARSSSESAASGSPSMPPLRKRTRTL